MADERFKPDANFKAGGVVGGYNSSDSDSLIALRLDGTTKRLLVDASITTGLSAQTGVVDGEAVEAADTGTLILGTDGSNYQVLKVNSDGELAINLETGDIQIGAVELKDSDSTARANIKVANTARTTATVVLATQAIDATGAVLSTSALATSANQLADGHAVTIDNISSNEVYVRGSGTAGSADAAVLTIQGIASMTALSVTESSPISGFATSALQLADGHNVTVDNISTNEIYVRGGGTAGSPQAGEVLAVQGISSGTAMAVTESSPISGFATSSNQLADGHNVTVDNISTNEIYVRGGGTAGSPQAGEVLAIQGIASGTNIQVIGTVTATSDSDPDLDGTALLGTHALLSGRSDVNTTVGITAEDSTHNAIHVAISDGEGIANVDASNRLGVIADLGSTDNAVLDNIALYTAGSETALEKIDGAIIGPAEPTIDSITQFAINLNAAANQVLVSSAASKQIWVYAVAYTCSVAGTVSFQDEDDTAVTGIMDHAANSGLSMGPSGNFAMPIWKLGTDKDLEVDVVTAAIDGFITYAIVSV